MLLCGSLLVEAGCFLLGILIGILILMIALKRAKAGLKDPWEFEEELDRLDEEQRQAAQEQEGSSDVEQRQAVQEQEGSSDEEQRQAVREQ